LSEVAAELGTGSLRRSAVLSAGFRGALAACSMLLLLTVVRTLGEREAGRFYLVFALVTLGASLGQAGMNHLLARRVAAARDGGSIVSACRTGLAIALRGSSAVALVLFLGAPLAARLFGDGELSLPLRILSAAVVPLTVLLVIGETWKGLGRPLLSMTAQVGLVPLVAVPLVLLFGSHGVVGAATAYALAAVVTMAVALVALLRSLPESTTEATEHARSTAAPLGSAGATFLYGVLAILQVRAPPLLLGALSGSAEITVLEVAMRVLTVPTLLLAGVNTMLAPRVARLYHAGRTDELAALCRSVARVSFVLIAPALVLMCALHAPIARFFGLEGTPLAALFAVLAVGEAVNLLTGPATLALLMSNHERAVRDLALVATAFSIALGAWAIPRWGAAGAAAGYATGIALVNLGAMAIARRTLGLWTAPFAPSGSDAAKSAAGPAASRGSIELDFFVLGAQKAGTTTLHAWLAARPELALPRIKETHYLCDPERQELGEAWYAASFARTRATRLCGEVDPEYLHSPEALQRLHARWPGARLVLLLRAPLERSRSHWAMSRARGLEPLDFQQALEAEEERLARGGAQAERDHGYLTRSRYAACLERLERLAPGHPLHVVRTDELFGARRDEAWGALCSFLGIAPAPPPADAERNARWSPRSGWLNRHLRARTGLRRVLGRLVPSRELRLRLGLWLDRWNQRPLAEREALPELDSRWYSRFEAEVTALERRTGLDLSGWRSERAPSVQGVP